MDIYDVAAWRPITHKQFVEHMGAATLVVAEPDRVDVRVEGLDDGRVRLVVWADLLFTEEGTPTSGPGPYLMSLYSPEQGGTVCFERSGPVELALS